MTTIPAEIMDKPWRELIAEEFRLVGESLDLTPRKSGAWFERYVKDASIEVSLWYGSHENPIMLQADDGDASTGVNHTITNTAPTRDIVAKVEQIRDCFGGWA